VRYDGELAVHPRVAYLALNYVDRFLSKGQLPFERKPWAPRLLAISCLSIAAKMQRVDAISMDYIQRDEEFMFDAVTIQRMERVVLGALEWRARSVTPLAFLGFFLSACFPPPRHLALLDAVKERAVDLLLRAQPGGEDGGVLAVRGGRVGAAGRRRGDRRRPPPRLPSRRGRLPLCK
uniref:Cyclin N-terminal domain-containing protein n=1 Tax=Aegilops tauschii subsp. strangulata TaxID=200361 RepID=A0A453BAY7_AEGTS